MGVMLRPASELGSDPVQSHGAHREEVALRRGGGGGGDL